MRQREWVRMGVLAGMALAAAVVGAAEPGASERAEAILAREEGRGRVLDAAFRARVKARLEAAADEQLA
ncbi:MAG TPA: hypothetical protein VF310_13725, partial [Vicinamibacteria bacterium]